MGMTFEERREAGKALRADVPRFELGAWRPARDRRDPVAVLEQQGETRIAELLPIRYGRMAVSPFAFFRGSAAIMAMDLATAPVTGLRVQACGDAHVSNFGKFATPERNLVFDINDFDETINGPWEWDLARLAASLHVVGRQREFSRPECDRIVAAAAAAYRQRMREYTMLPTLRVWYDHTDVEAILAHFPAKFRPVVKRDIKKARRKGHVRAVAKLTSDVDGVVRFAEDPPLFVHLDNTEADLGDVAAAVEAYRGTLAHERLALFDRFEVVDVARKVVGVGSVGTTCWVCLLEGPDRPGGDRIILQVKEAPPSVLEPYVGASGFDHQGERVVAGQRTTQAASDVFLGWCQGPRTGREYYVRQLWDYKGSGDPLVMSADHLAYYGTLCALTLARAHARTGDPVQLSGYLGKTDTFDKSVTRFAATYAEQNEEDHAAFVEAIESARLPATTDL